jgi:hypothetical protein
MPAETELNCRECGGRHTVCLPDADMLTDGMVYEYTCPKTKRTVRRTIEDWAKVVTACSRSALVLQAVSER